MRLPELTVLVLLVVLLATAAEAAFPAQVVLERVVPLNKGVLLADLRDLDRARHARTSVVNLPVESTIAPFSDG
jgi:hypothetical protein